MWTKIFNSRQAIYKYSVPFLLGATLLYSFKLSQVQPDKLITGLGNSLELLLEMFPPDVTDMRTYLSLSLETIGIGVVGSAVGLVFSFFLSFLAASNTSPNGYVYKFARTLTNLLRAIPEIVYALLFVGVLGIGALPGILAIILHTVGLATKFYSEALEEVDTKPVEALLATGASKYAVIRYAMLPQVFPLFVGYTMYILDHNIRVVVGLGIVGAGGVGLELFRRLRQFQYDKVATIVLIIILLVSLISKVSEYVRTSYLEGRFLSRKTRIFDGIILSVYGLVTLLSIFHVASKWNEILSSIPRLFETLRGMWPPDFSEISEYLFLIGETVAMAISGTALAAIFASLLALISAKNVMRHSFIRNLGVEIANFLRAMPDILFALFFVVAIGLGPFPGVLALALSSAGLLAKFYTEVIENIDEKQLEGVEAVGASKIQKIRFAIIPQILPLFNSYNLYILDRNVRTSTVLGIVGAGGIGYLLTVSIKLMEYQKTVAIILIIFLTVTLVDILSAKLRRKILE